MKSTTRKTSPVLCDTQHLSPELFTTCGWIRNTREGWRRSTPWGQAHLRQIAESASWTHYLLEGGALHMPTRGTYLQHQHDLAGPFKYVQDAAGRVVCRGDVPRFADPAQESMADPLQPAQSAWTWQWLRQATDLVDGFAWEDAPVFDPRTVVEWLEQRGRIASCDGQRVLVHMSLSGNFAQIRCQRQGQLGVQLTAELSALENLPPRVQRARLHFVAEAHERLPIARFIVDKSCPSRLSCEISLGDVVIPGTWFSVALEVMESAVTHTHRELQALRDPTLAHHYLAVNTASSPCRAERTRS